MDFNVNDILADLILEHYSILKVLDRFGIKLGLGNQTINEVCELYQLNPELFCLIINMYCDENFEVHSISNYDSIPQLLLYLEQSHNYFISEKIPEIQHEISILVKTIEAPNDSLILDFFDSYRDEVNEHMGHENTVVFDYVKTLYENYQDEKLMIRKDNFSILDYEKDHDDIEQVLLDLKNLLLKYLPQNDLKDNRVKVLMDLFQLEHELHNHQRIEDELLIPIVRKLEDSMTSKKLLSHV